MDLKQLDEIEIRVLGSLLEKSFTTPDYYPMTLNGLMAACNQKTSRNPVMNVNEASCMEAIGTLRKKGLVSTITGGLGRAVRYQHNLGIAYPLIPSETILLCLLMLRGPQTPGELNTNAGRMHDFEAIENVQSALEGLAQREPPFVKKLSKQPGQKELRYIHLFGAPFVDGDGETFAEFPEGQTFTGHRSDMQARLTRLEIELEDLKAAFQKLLKELGV